jgi:dienelactone hydrolase
MKDRITMEGRDGAFGAYVARPKALPAPAVVVLQELFGVNAWARANALLEEKKITSPSRSFEV